MAPDILCIGAVMWDVIGRPDPRVADALVPGADLPGRVVRLPGGVALNVATTLRRLGMRPALLGVVGRDPEGCALVESCAAMGLVTDHLLRTDDPSDRYVAIEGRDGLVGAIADTRTLDAAGARVLAPLADGSLPQPWSGPVVVDGNGAGGLMAEVARSELLAAADLRLALASSGKAAALIPLLGHPSAVLHLNRQEAVAMLGHALKDAEAAARALVDRGAARALVTDGPRAAADATRDGVVLATPRAVTAHRTIGAGDVFTAAHVAAEARGAGRRVALAAALEAATDHVARLS